MKTVANAKTSAITMLVERIPVGTVCSGYISRFQHRKGDYTIANTLLRTARGLVTLDEYPLDTWSEGLTDLNQLWVHEYVEYPNAELRLNDPATPEGY